jgi:hypothetical protein
MNTSARTFIISEILSPDLALRESAARLINQLESIKDSEIVVDFAGVKSITRSFAHEYCRRKSESAKRISEIHVAANIQKMMTAASQTSKPRSKSLELDSVPVVVL